MSKGKYIHYLPGNPDRSYSTLLLDPKGKVYASNLELWSEIYQFGERSSGNVRSICMSSKKNCVIMLKVLPSGVSELYNFDVSKNETQKIGKVTIDGKPVMNVINITSVFYDKSGSDFELYGLVPSGSLGRTDAFIRIDPITCVVRKKMLLGRCDVLCIGHVPNVSGSRGGWGGITTFLWTKGGGLYGMHWENEDCFLEKKGYRPSSGFCMKDISFSPLSGNLYGINDESVFKINVSFGSLDKVCDLPDQCAAICMLPQFAPSKLPYNKKDQNENKKVNEKKKKAKNVSKEDEEEYNLLKEWKIVIPDVTPLNQDRSAVVSAANSVASTKQNRRVRRNTWGKLHRSVEMRAPKNDENDVTESEDVENMSIADFLASIKLSMYLSNFEEEAVDDVKLLSSMLSESKEEFMDLLKNDLKIKKLGHRYRILMKLKK